MIPIEHIGLTIIDYYMSSILSFGFRFAALEVTLFCFNNTTRTHASCGALGGMKKAQYVHNSLLIGIDPRHTDRVWSINRDWSHS